VLKLDVKEAIAKRRAYRSLEPVEMTEEILNDLAESASLSASCFNNQPWRYVFVHYKEMLTKMREAIKQGNEWTHKASLIIAVLSRKDLDCVIREREYYMFDTGMSTAFLILRATELGLVAHPIAGYSPKKTREILNIPEEMDVITLVIVGKKSQELNPVLSEKQIGWELERPKRKPINELVFMNSYQ
jgi:nitroreductase